MSYKFSNKSKLYLSSCNKKLQFVFRKVIDIIDCSILEGHRTEEQHEIFYHKGLTQVKYLGSKHSRKPSNAVHAMPYPIDWNDREGITYFAGIVKGVSAENNIKIRWGGDWDSDNDLKDNNFDDLAHYEMEE